MNLEPKTRVRFDQRVLFFKWKPSHERYAVVGGLSLVVAVLHKGSWRVVYEDRPPKLRAQEHGYRALAVTDMNGDGRPELIVHNGEQGGEWYGD